MRRVEILIRDVLVWQGVSYTSKISRWGSRIERSWKSRWCKKFPRVMKKALLCCKCFRQVRGRGRGRGSRSNSVYTNRASFFHDGVLLISGMIADGQLSRRPRDFMVSTFVVDTTRHDESTKIRIICDCLLDASRRLLEGKPTNKSQKIRKEAGSVPTNGFGGFFS